MSDQHHSPSKITPIDAPIDESEVSPRKRSPDLGERGVLMADYRNYRQLAQQLNCHEITIKRWCARGCGPRKTKLGNRRVYFHVDDVKEWLLSHRVVDEGIAEAAE